MSCLEVLGLISLIAYIVVEVFRIAFMLGKNVKKITARPEKTAVI